MKHPIDPFISHLAQVLQNTAATVASSDFDLHPEISRDVKLRDAAVLIALQQDRQGHWWLWLTRRARDMRIHAGQIALPGGKMDAKDQSATDTALREASEEIGLPPAKVTRLGQLPMHQTVSDFRVTPVIGVLGADFMPVAAQSEVAEVFAIPLKHVMTLKNYRIQERQWQGQMRRYYTVPYGPHYIWGATARILRQFAQMAAHAD